MVEKGSLKNHLLGGIIGRNDGHHQVLFEQTVDSKTQIHVVASTRHGDTAVSSTLTTLTMEPPLNFTPRKSYSEPPPRSSLTTHPSRACQNHGSLPKTKTPPVRAPSSTQDSCLISSHISQKTKGVAEQTTRTRHHIFHGYTCRGSHKNLRIPLRQEQRAAISPTALCRLQDHPSRMPTHLLPGFAPRVHLDFQKAGGNTRILSIRARLKTSQRAILQA